MSSGPSWTSSVGWHAPSSADSVVHLEPWGPDDLPLLEQLLGDPVMMAHLGGPESSEKIAERHLRFQRLGDAGTGRMFKIVDDATRDGVGSVGYWPRIWHCFSTPGSRPPFTARDAAAHGPHDARAFGHCAAPQASPTPTPTPTPPPTSTFQFDSSAYAIQEACTAVTVRVVRQGPTDQPAAVDMASNDGTAKQKGDYTIVVGHLVFAAGETEKTFQVLISDDGYTEGAESATLVLQNPANGTVGTPGSATLQIVDNIPETNSNSIDVSRTRRTLCSRQ